MATRDIRALMDEVRAARPVVVREDGQVEREEEARENAAEEREQTGQPMRRQRVKPATFGAAALGHDEYRLHERVVGRMSELATEFQGLETAALGVGPDRRTVTDVIACGPSAHRGWSTCGLDPEYLNPLLETARGRGLIWNAILHVHPPNCPTPSEMDRSAVRDLLSDPDTGLGESVLFPITMRAARRTFETRFFVAKGADADFCEVHPVIVSDAVNSRRPSSRDAGRLAWALSVQRARRVARDIASLAAAGFATGHNESPNGQQFLRVERRGVAVVALLPDEYPLAPPILYAECGAELREVPARELPSLIGWSSLRDLTDLAQEAMKSIEDEREAELLVLRPRPIELIRRVSSLGSSPREAAERPQEEP